MKKRDLRESREFYKFFHQHNRIPWKSDSIRHVWAKLPLLRGLAVAFLSLAIATVTLRVLEPQMARLLFSTSTETINAFRIAWIFAVWLIVHFSKSASSYLKKRVEHRFRTQTIELVRRDLFRHYASLPIGYYEAKSAGYILSRQLDDTDDIDGVLFVDLVDAIFAAIELLAIVTILFATNWLLASISVILFAGGARFRMLFPLRQVYAHHNESKALLTRELSQTISSMSLIKASASEEYESLRLRKMFSRYARARFHRDDLRFRQTNLSSFIDGLSTPLILVLGGFLTLQGALSMGALLAILLYHPRAQAAFSRLMVSVPRYNTGKAYTDRIWESHSIKVEDNSGDLTFAGFQSSIDFNDVSFSYGENRVLDGVSFVAKKGETTAIVGPSGSGKSTIIRLLLRFNDVSAGTVTIDGTDIRLYELASFRKKIGFVPQDPFLFHRTLQQNIAYSSKSNADDRERLIASLKTANAWSFVQKLPDGLRSLVGDRGVRLSGGERQRICIAREVYADPPILLLDEATSALDTISEQAVQKGIENAETGRTTIVVAHRLSTIRAANNIVVLESGKVAEQGTHAQLMRNNGLYAKLCALQDSEESGELT